MQDKLFKSISNLARPEKTRMEYLNHPDTDGARETLFNRGVTKCCWQSDQARTARGRTHSSFAWVLVGFLVTIPISSEVQSIRSL